VRDLEAIRREPGHRAVEQAEPGGAAELRGRVEEQLHAEADAEHRLSRRPPPGDQLVEPERVDPFHRPRKCADPGQDDAVGRARRRVAGADLHRGADVLERLLDGAQVPHPIVEDE